MADVYPPDNLPPPPEARSNEALLIVSWLWVGVPLAWGVWETVRTSLPLFQ
jgi:hypothetical protein